MTYGYASQKCINDLIKWMTDEGDHGEISVIEIIAFIDKYIPNTLEKYNTTMMEGD